MRPVNTLYAVFLAITSSFCSSSLFIPQAFADVQIIANQGSSDDSLSKKDIKKIFLGKKTKWDNGKKIVLATMTKGDTHAAFLKKYTGKTEAQFKNFWKKQVFTGKGQMPKKFADTEKVIEFVAKTPGAIGYIDAGSDVGSIKKIDIK